MKDNAERLLHNYGHVAERIAPGLVPIESYFEHMERYVLAGHLIRGRNTAVDLACGTGYGTSYLSQRSVKQIIGIDIEEDVVAYAQSAYAVPAGGLTFCTGGADSIPIAKRSIDAFVSFETIEHVPNPARFLAEVRRVLKPGGMLVLSTPNKRLSSRRARNPYHISELYLEELQEMLAGISLEITQIYGEGISSNNNSNVEGAGGLLYKEAARRLLPDSVLDWSRRYYLLPKRTGIPARVVNWYWTAPHRFEEWIAQNSFHSSYRPTLTDPSRLAQAKESYNTFIIVAIKAG